MRSLLLIVLLAVFPASAIAADGFSGPKRQFRAVTVAELKNLPDDALVVLTGKIVSQIDDEHYVFADDTGSVTLEVDDDLWIGLPVSPEDTLRIHGKIDKDYGKIEVEAKRIDKL